ncbi:MAG TPA: M56 family metallopeptidase [Dokdonella sp.]|uniref:M56 family metallopeptidase n=1 Tax=Dokdonella sp. TaxID=2291710 RepID=UPI002D808ACC|nr:M56 family metallopeptidase [Dokdonella sp.]HET9033257.1 M56 family metallopeptidase [Dokdonella sp.]
MNPMIAEMPWIQALGWSLIHFLWQGAVVGMLFAVVRALLPKERSSARYLIGLIALLVLVVCPLLTFFVLVSPMAAESTPLGDVVVATSMEASSVLFTGTSTGFDGWLPMLVAGWLSGVALMIWRALYQWRALERIAARLAWRQVEIEEMLIGVAQRFGSLPGVRVLVSASIDTPTLIGWFKPVILLPAAVVIGFPRQQLELILAHELGHLRRYDHLVNLGQAVIETLLFYHPVVHWISREVRHEREVCCDNLVLRLTDSEPREYARTLAALEDVRQFTPQLAVAASGGMLLDRVRRIVGSKTPGKHHRRSLLGIWLIAASCSIVIPAVLFVTQSGSEDASTDSNTLAQVETVADKPVLDPPQVSVPMPALTIADVPLPAVPPETNAEPRVAAVGVVDKRSGSVDSIAVASVPAPPVADVASAGNGALEIADMPLVSAPLTLASVARVESTEPAPRLVRKISPDYPDSGFGSLHSKVDFEFSIDDRGNVRNIRLVDGNATGAFAAAARNALQLWKFDPQSVMNRQDKKYRQSFEFVSKSYVAKTDMDGPCTPPIGSHICRPGRGFHAVRAKADKAALLQAQLLASEFGDVGEVCQPLTGSHICRTGPEASVALRTDASQATSAHVIVLTGGAN